MTGASALPMLAGSAIVAMAALAEANPEEAPLLRETQLGGLVATVRTDDLTREVGAPIACTILFDGPDAGSVSIDPVETLGEFDVLSVDTPRRLAPDRAVFALEVVLSTLASGRVTPAPLGVRWLHGADELTGKVEFPELSVQSLLGEQVDPSQFRDIAGLIEIRSPIDWLPWLAGGAVIAAVAAAGWWMLRNRAVAPVAPDAWALAELGKLERAALPERGAYGLYYDELTGIVRRYVAMRFAIRAEQQTSREFIDAARTHAEFPADEADRLKDLLRLADLVKFAQAEPTRGECDTNIGEARAFIERTRPVAKEATT